ncbi:MAG: WhiB family transcriptional regulator [Actinobacteria bacterium]|nr:MAG: WhiB family transcriptional regulator [Actinomycetota bacterium]
MRSAGRHAKSRAEAAAGGGPTTDTDEGGVVTVRTSHVSWQRRAACRGPEARLFFPPSATETRPARAQREARAKAICATCVVRGECLEEALRLRDFHGIWGGLNEHERRALVDA